MSSLLPTDRPAERAGRFRAGSNIATGIGAALGLSMTSTLAGALLARVLDLSELFPDVLARPVWALTAAVGMVGSGMMVAEVSRRQARTAVTAAAAIVFLIVFEITRAIETTGVEGVELPAVIAGTAVYAALLSFGVAVRSRRLGAPALQPPAP